MPNKNNELNICMDNATAALADGRKDAAGKYFREALMLAPENAEANFSIGRMAAESGDFDTALSHLLKAVETSPENPEFLCAYIDVLIQAGRKTEARVLLDLAVQRGVGPDAVRALLQKLTSPESQPSDRDAASGGPQVHQHAAIGDQVQTSPSPVLPMRTDVDSVLAAFRAGRFDQVIALASAFSDRFPDHEFGWKALGAAWQSLGQFTEAVAPMQKAAALSPSDPEARFNLGVALQATGQLAEAETQFREALRIAPDYVDAAINLGTVVHGLRRLGEGAAILRGVLSVQPESLPAWRNLGLICVDLGEASEAERCFLRLLELVPGYAQGHLELARVQKSLGQPAKAESSCREAIRLEPGNADHYCFLGHLLLDADRTLEAEQSFAKALEINPKHGLALDGLGRMYRVSGRLDRARDVFERAADLYPEDPARQVNLGVVLQELGEASAAEGAYHRALATDREHIQALFNLGVVLQETGRLEEAVDCFRKTQSLAPDYLQVHVNCGNALRDLGRIQEAEACYRQGIDSNPDDPSGYLNLGMSLEDSDKSEEAIKAYRAGLARFPEHETMNVSLARVLGASGCPDESLAISETLLGLNPESHQALICKSIALRALGRGQESEEALQAALAIDPGNNGGRSMLLFQLAESDSTSPKELFAEHRRFGEIMEAPYRDHWPDHQNSKDPDRELRVGFVSADLRDHTLAFFAQPLLAELARFPDLCLHAFHNHIVEDSTTAAIRPSFRHWHRIAGLPDKTVFDLIRREKIDILIDLSGHTRGQRLEVFARKPAPVQASWIGYPATTGLTSIDYYLADRFLFPVEEFGWQFTEHLVHLPASVPFSPHQCAPSVNALPAMSNGHVTFGSFNRQSKISPRVIDLWARLMREVPGSRLIQAGLVGGDQTRALVSAFADNGIGLDRLMLLPRMGQAAYQSLHLKVDLALDTFPYAGGTTTLHALWMGVPTLTLDCGKPASRQGAFALGHVGLEQFIATGEDDFVVRGKRLATDWQELSTIRSSLRSRFLASALSKPDLIAAGLHQALRIMWQRRCRGMPAEHISVTGAPSTGAC